MKDLGIGNIIRSLERFKEEYSSKDKEGNDTESVDTKNFKVMFNDNFKTSRKSDAISINLKSLKLYPFI